MDKLSDKIKTGLDELRILVLGVQILLGFQYRAVLERGFAQLPPSAQVGNLVALGLLLLALALLLLPAPYHYLVLQGNNSQGFQRLISRTAGLALLPFALSLGAGLYVVAVKLLGQAGGLVAGLLGAAVALFWWYGYELLRRPGRAAREDGAMQEDGNAGPAEQTAVKDKITDALTEVRMVLPGAQALLGFQFAGMLVEGFDKLPESSKWIHLASLGLIALSTILLMTPAAYHRIVYDGENTEEFYHFASRMLLAAMAFLALGLAGDFYVVLLKVINSPAWALALTGLLLVVFFGLWFGYTLYRRASRLRPES